MLLDIKILAWRPGETEREHEVDLPLEESKLFQKVQGGTWDQGVQEDAPEVVIKKEGQG